MKICSAVLELFHVYRQMHSWSNFKRRSVGHECAWKWLHYTRLKYFNL